MLIIHFQDTICEGDSDVYQSDSTELSSECDEMDEDDNGI